LCYQPILILYHLEGQACIMNKVAIAVLTLAAVANGEGRRLEGSYEFRAGGRVHRVQYKVTQAVPDEAIVAIDEAEGLGDVYCSGWGEVQMNFKDEEDAKKYQKFIVDKVASDDGAFVVTEGTRCNNRGEKSGTVALTTPQA